ncbi:MAG: hypothetical protein KIT17_17835 [Rubrivivax sp.]|nr:hypothetical protein [Rubrivivax sp.]MCW5635202.1 hypothetical protein [Rubrivivax sp.]
MKVPEKARICSRMNSSIATTITGCSFVIEASPLADCSTEPPTATR